jgi:uncharacterized membrane protein
MMLLWLPKYPKQKRQLAALAMAVLQELKIKSIVHYWSTSKKLFITAPVSQFLCSAGQEVPEEKSRRGKIHQEIRQGRPLYHTEQRRRRLRHAHEDIVRAPQRGAHFMMMMMMMMIRI